MEWDDDGYAPLLSGRLSGTIETNLNVLLSTALPFSAPLGVAIAYLGGTLVNRSNTMIVTLSSQPGDRGSLFLDSHSVCDSVFELASDLARDLAHHWLSTHS